MSRKSICLQNFFKGTALLRAALPPRDYPKFRRVSSDSRTKGTETTPVESEHNPTQTENDFQTESEDARLLQNEIRFRP